MSAKSRAALTAEQLVLLPDNSTKFITPAKLREALENVNDSMYNPTTDGVIFGSIESKTYAQWEVIRAASGLSNYINKYIFVSDKSVYLMPISVNKFGNKGFYLLSGFYNSCIYDFDNDIFYEISDSKGNKISNEFHNYFRFNDPDVNNNVVNGFMRMEGSTGFTNKNQIECGANVYAHTATRTGQFSNNRIFKGAITVSSLIGNFVENVMDTAFGITANLDSGVTVSGCYFQHTVANIILDPTKGYANKTIRAGFSNFDQNYTITGLTTLTFNATYGGIIGIANLSSTNATETINLFANAPTNHPFRIYPASGLTVTFTHATGANQPICAGGISAVIDGTKGDWIEFTYINTRFYQTDGETY